MSNFGHGRGCPMCNKTPVGGTPEPEVETKEDRWGRTFQDNFDEASRRTVQMYGIFFVYPTQVTQTCSRCQQTTTYNPATDEVPCCFRSNQ